jgi:hypothetical protein
LTSSEATAANSDAALRGRRVAGRLTWSGPALMLFARTVLAVVAQGLVAAAYAAQGSGTPWRDAAAWLPVYGTLIDAGCLGLLWWLTRREGMRLADLIGFDRRRLGRDFLLGLALIAPSLLVILFGNFAASLLVYGSADMPRVFAPLPLPATLYAVLVFPLVWGIVEQSTYNGYLAPRFRLLSGSTLVAVAAVGFAWSFQHAVMPLTFDADFMLYRTLSPLASSTFFILVHMRLRRIVPLAIAHWLMNAGAAFMEGLWPLLR